MAIYNGIYRWDGTKKDSFDPIAWNPGSYDVKILDLSSMLGLSSALGKVLPFKSVICLYAQTGEGQSISAQPEKFAKRICSDFSLDIERVLWVEDLLTEKDRYEVVLFTRTGKMGNGFFYRTEKRKALEAENKLIDKALQDMTAETSAAKGV